jgi:hypothetical protein
MSDKPKPALCKAGQRLRREINAAWPNRDKTSDGWIGDTAHAARPSDHNPDPKTGVVRALDIDRDLDLKNKTASWELAERLRIMAATGADKGRISYLIHMGKICSARRDASGRKWRWRDYTGPNKHFGHMHVSFTKAGDTDGSTWGIV